MKYYASFGYATSSFASATRPDVVKEYLLTDNEALPNDFISSEGGRTGRAARRRHSRLVGNVREHRPRLTDSASVARRRELHRGRPSSSGGYGNTHRRADTGHGPDADRERQGRQVPRVPPALQLPRRRVRHGRQRADLHDVTQSDSGLNAGYFVFRSEIFDYMERARISSRSRSGD